MLLKILMHFLGSPVLTPLAISVVTWVVNTYTNALKSLPNVITRGLIVVVPPLMAWVTTQVSQMVGKPLDFSSATAAAGSLVAIVIYELGHAKGKTKATAS